MNKMKRHIIHPHTTRLSWWVRGWTVCAFWLHLILRQDRALPSSWPPPLPLSFSALWWASGPISHSTRKTKRWTREGGGKKERKLGYQPAIHGISGLIKNTRWCKKRGQRFSSLFSFFLSLLSPQKGKRRAEEGGG